MTLQEEKENKLIKFIKDNDIKFNPGNRNTPAVIIAGFSKYLKFEYWEDVLQFLYDGTEEIDLDDDSYDELERVLEWVFNTAERDYSLFWNTPEAKQYKF